MPDNTTNNMDKIVTPGEVLGVIEEFSPGENCFEIDGQVISETLGKFKQDKDHLVNIIPCKEAFSPKEGAFALGYVTELRKQIANVTLTHFKFGKKNSLQSIKFTIHAIIHISNVSDRFIRAIHDGVRPGDYILCKVISTSPDYRVSLFGSRDLGVISATCYSCGQEVNHVLKRNLLRCKNCGATQNRVLSSYFGKLENLV
ncbi:MAG: Exosome complex component Csl4 [Candidatus Heimdallarchaeota archaeon LC_3]|nr:MAG: Exosome complex component Csl4 [Candidatus Heimdallarchaeota archaeon LC_3]